MPEGEADRAGPAGTSAPERIAMERIVAADGTRVAAYDEGGSGPDLLMVHATGFCAATLRPLARHLSDRFHCWTIDLRAQGRSDPPPDGDFRWAGFADDVRSAVDQLGLRRPLGFGHSCGGAATVLAEETRPGTFDALYCFEPVILPLGPSDEPVPDNPLSSGARRRRSTFPSPDDAFANFASKRPFCELDPSVLRLYVDEGLETIPRNEGGDGRAVRLRCRRENEAEIYAWGASHGAFARLSAVRCPVTLACGAETDTFGPPALEVLAAPIRVARIEVFPGLGHFGPLEDPVTVARSIGEAFRDRGTPEP